MKLSKVFYEFYHNHKYNKNHSLFRNKKIMKMNGVDNT